MEKYPLFQMVLRKRIILVLPGTQGYSSNCKGREEASMQQAVYSRQKESSFQVSYYEKRINFEVFHALTDGTGAMHFLQELVSNYLKKAHPEQDLPSLPVTDMSTPGDQEEDSFFPVLFLGYSRKF